MNGAVKLDFSKTQLHGRKEELRRLRDAFRRISNPQSSNSEVVLVGGVSGCGKSRLIRSFRKLVDEDQAYFCVARQEENSAALPPFSAIVACLQELVMQMLQHASHEVWHAKLKESLSVDIGLLATIIPAIRDFVEDNDDPSTVSSPHPHYPKSRPASVYVDVESKPEWSLERLRFVIRDFVRTIGKVRPVVFVIEDCQWAGRETLHIIQSLVADTYSRHFLFVGTHCWSMDTSDENPVTQFRQQIPVTKLTEVSLGRLQLDHINALVASLLQQEELEVRELAKLVHEATNGNAFFVMQFLQLLQQQGLLFFSLIGFEWEWNVARIRSDCCIPENVKDLIRAKIQMLPLKLRVALTHAACLDLNSFDTETLFEVVQIVQATNATGMMTADEAAIAHSTRRLNGSYQQSPGRPNGRKEPEPAVADKKEKGEDEGTEEEEKESAIIESSVELEQILDAIMDEELLEKVDAGQYRFGNHCVKECAYSLLPKGTNKSRLHLRIGRHLHRISEQLRETEVSASRRFRMGSSSTLTEVDPGERLLFLAMHHLNKGSALIAEPNENAKLAALNLQAALVSAKKSSFDPAAKYLETGVALLEEENRWEQHYELSLNMYSMLARMRYCCGYVESCRQAIEEVLRNVTTLSDKLDVYGTLLACLQHNGRIDEAIQLILFILSQLGVQFPQNHLSVHLVKAIAKTRKLLRTKSNEQLLSMPQMKEEDLLAAIDFLAYLRDFAHSSSYPEYQTLATLKVVELSLEKGQNKLTAQSFAICGMLLASMGNYDLGHRYGRLALQMSCENEPSIQDGPTVAIVHYFIYHWKRPYRESLEHVLRAYEMTLASGDIERLFHSVGCYSYTFFCCGLQLRHLANDMRKFSDALTDFMQLEHLDLFRNYWQMVLNLMGRCKNPLELTGVAMNQSLCIERWIDGRFAPALQANFFCRMVLAVFFGDLNQADLMSSRLCSAEVEGPSPWRAPRLLYQGIVAFSNAKATGKRKYRKKGRDFMNQLEKFVKNGAVNCDHMLLFLQAELEALGDNEDRVSSAYDAAIASASRLGFLHHEALANERAGIYFLNKGEDEWGAAYMTNALELYSKWDAVGKVRDLENKYEFLGDLLAEQEYSSFAHRSEQAPRTRLQKN